MGRPWSPIQRVGFRFLFAYLLLFFFPFPGGMVNPPWLGLGADRIWDAVVPWIAGLLDIDVPNLNNGGSGDTTFHQIRVLCIAFAAMLITVVWSILDRRRTEYRTLFAWSRVWMRYVIAVCMLTYGSSKVLMVQFEPPSYGRLIQPVGELSPMALLWTFMGSSVAYTTFTGITEVVSGVLLFFRRTTTLGALLVVAIMSNVVMLNLSYDVPVKLGSIHLLILAMVLLAPQATRLLDFFVLNRATRPADLGPAWPSPRIPLGVKTILIVSLLVYLSWDTQRKFHMQASNREAEPLPPEGNYAVQTFKRNGAEVAPSTNPDDFPWTSFSLRKGVVGVRTRDGSLRRFSAEGDITAEEVRLLPLGERMTPIPGVAPAGSLRLSVATDGRASVAGTLNGYRVEAALRRRNAADMPLRSRGFRWVSEAPYFHMFPDDKGSR